MIFKRVYTCSFVERLERNIQITNYKLQITNSKILEKRNKKFSKNTTNITLHFTEYIQRDGENDKFRFFLNFFFKFQNGQK